MADLASGCMCYRIWLVLAWQDTKQRYRRSTIGPFWITISTGIMVALMGPLYGSLLKQNFGTYLQYLAVSMVIWGFISGYINDSCNAFIGAEEYIKQIKLPLTVHVLRVLAKNFITLLHNVLIILIVLFFYPPQDFTSLLLLPVGLCLVLGNLVWIGLVLAIVSARFRDIPLIVTNLVQAAFFLSPILWKVDMLGNKKFLAEFNPIYHFMELIRAPIVGGQMNHHSLLAALLMLVTGWGVALVLLSKFRSRVAYWV